MCPGGDGAFEWHGVHARRTAPCSQMEGLLLCSTVSLNSARWQQEDTRLHTTDESRELRSDQCFVSEPANFLINESSFFLGKELRWWINWLSSLAVAVGNSCTADFTIKQILKERFYKVNCSKLWNQSFEDQSKFWTYYKSGHFVCFLCGVSRKRQLPRGSWVFRWRGLWSWSTIKIKKIRES